MALWRAWVVASDSLGSEPSVLLLIIGLCITAVLMYSCGRKFIEFDRRSINQPCATEQRRCAAAFSGEAKVGNDVKKRRKRSKKSKKQRTEADDEECPVFPAEGTGPEELKAVADGGSGGRSKGINSNSVSSTDSQSSWSDRGKQPGDAADGTTKPDSTRSPDRAQNPPRDKRGFPRECSRTKARGKRSQDTQGHCERMRCDSLSAMDGKCKDGSNIRRGNIWDHRPKREPPHRAPTEDFRRSPRNRRSSVDDGSLEREVQKTEKPRDLSLGEVTDEAGNEGKETTSILKKCNQEEGALKKGFSNGRFRQPPGRLQRTKSNENQDITWAKPRDVAEGTKTLHSDKKQQFRKPASICYSAENRSGDSINQQRSGKRNGPRFVKIEVNAKNDTGLERCGNLSVSEQEKCTSSRVAKDIFTRTESLDSGYSEEIASPTGESQEEGCVFCSADDDIPASPLKSSRTRVKSTSEPKASTKTERTKKGAINVECILRHLQLANGQSRSDKKGRTRIDPEVRERIANPKHRVRMPDKPFEHLSLANQKRTEHTNESHVDGIFGRKWREKLHEELDRSDSSDASGDEHDSAWDLRDDICPMFMIWGVCRQQGGCGLRHPSYRYLDSPAETPPRLAQEETKRDPICYAAVLQREKDSQAEIFHNDALTSQSKITLGESEPSYSRAVCEGKGGQQQGSVQAVTGKEQSFDEAWPALGPAGAQPTGSNRLPQGRKSTRAAPKGLQDPRPESEAAKRFAENLRNVFDQSAVDEASREEREKSECQGEYCYETEDVKWYNYQRDAVQNDAERRSAFLSDVIVTDDNAASKTLTPRLEVDSTLCDICMDRPKDATLVCGHRFCYMCALQMRLDERVCAVCRRCIVSVIKTYN